MKKHKKNNTSQNFDYLALSKDLGETEEGYRIGTYETSRGSRYIDIRFSTKVTRTLYFRLFNAATIKEATKCARLRMYLPTKDGFPKQIHCRDTRLEDWNLDQQEITDLLFNLASLNNIEVPDFLKDTWIRINLWGLMQERHNQLIKNKKGFEEISIDPEYFDIPNYNYLLPCNRPPKPVSCWVDVDGIVVYGDCKADCVRNNMSKKMKDDTGESPVGIFKDEYGTKYVQARACEIEPCFFVWNASSILAATKCARISMVKPRFIEPDDNSRFKECWRLNEVELENLVKFLQNNKEKTSWRNGELKNNWERTVYYYNNQAGFFDNDELLLPDDAPMPDYLHMEEPLIIK